jgi:hypothetical protein
MLPAGMRLAVGIGLALLASQSSACTDASPPPRVAVHDSFPARFAASQLAAPPPRPFVKSVSLGFIGDGPIGTEPTPPFHLPYWERPFPCEWTNTCWLAPPPPVCPCGMIP